MPNFIKYIIFTIIIAMSPLIILGVAGFTNSDFFQKNFYPEDYWRKRVETRIYSIELYANQLESCHLEIIKLEKNKDIEIRQLILDYGMTEKSAVDVYVAQVRGMKMYCDSLDGVLDNQKDELEKAKINLKQVQ